MAGVAGMGSPSKVEIPQPEAPQAPEPVAQMQAMPSAKPSLDEIFNAPADQQEQARPSLDEIFGATAVAPVYNGAEPVTTDLPSVSDRIGEIPSRAKASFAVTDKELLASLKQSFGDKNVRKGEGYNPDIEYRGSDGKWRVWDAGTTVEDFTVDLARPILEEIPASAATIASGIPAVGAALASGGVALPASAAGVAAARAGGALVGQGLGDLAQKALGIPYDQNRSAALEYGLSAALAPLSGALADFATKKIAARAAASRSIKLLPPEELYKTEVSGIREALDKVKELGGMDNIPGTDTPVMLSHLNPSNKNALELTKSASALNGFKQVQEQITQGFQDASKTFLKTLGNIDTEKATGQEFKNYVQSAIKQEGEAIGKVRDGLIDAAGNGELPVPNLKNKVESFAKDIGFNIDGSTDVSKLKGYLVDEAGYSKQAAEVIVNKTNRMLEKVTNKEGRMTAQELVGAYEEMNGLYKNILKGGSETSPLFRQKVGEMRRFFADELIDKTEVVLDPAAKKSYQASLSRFKELMDSSDEFSKLLDKDALASSSLSKAIFSKGVDGLDTANATKVLLKDRPDLLDDVKGSYLKDIMAESFNEASQKIDWVKFNKKLLDPKSKEVMNAMFGKEGIDGIKAFQTVAQAIEKGDVPAAGSPNRVTFLKNMALSFKSMLATGNAGAELIKQVDSSDALAQIISKEGIDNFLKNAPKDSKPLLKSVLTGAVAAAQRSAQVSEVPIRRAGKNFSKDRANELNKENP